MPRRLARLLPALLCGGLVVFAYAGSLRNAFHFDDAHVVVSNLYLRSLSNVPHFFTDARTFSGLPANATYRPLVSTTLALDYRLGGGLDPLAFRLDQLLQLLLLWGALAALYRKLFDLALPDRRNGLLALLSATLFAVHTANTETMNLMHVRSEILSALGVAAAFLLWLGSRRARRTGLYLLPVAVGALAKVPAVMFAPLLLVLSLLLVARWRGEGLASPGTHAKLARAARAALPAFVAGAAIYAFVAYMNAEGQTYGGGDRLDYARTQAWAWLHYLRLFVLPAGLTADGDLALVTEWWDTRLFAGLGFLALLATAFVAAARRRRAWPVAFGLAWFALGLLPTSSVLPLAEPVNEHRYFLSYVGLVLSAAWGARLALASPALGSPRAKAAAALAGGIVLLVGHASGTRARNEVWRTEESLWRDVATKSPRNGRGLMNYGLALMKRGAYDEARAAFEAARRLLPEYAVLEVNLGVLEGATGRPDAAEAHFRRALSLDPAAPSSRTFYARWLAEQGRAAEAVPLLVEAIRIGPADELPRRLLVPLLAARGEKEAVVREARELLARAPDDAWAAAWAAGRPPFSPASEGARSWFELGLARGSARRYAESAVAYRAALEVAPDSSDTLNNLGWTLGELGFHDEGAAALRRALALRPGWDRALANLALVEARSAASSAARPPDRE
ncbi:MAG: tetratricopeptide repeat protein [Thermoanaerobaculia bacterium]